MTSLGVEWGAKYTLTGPDGTVVVFNDSTDPNFIGVLSPESSGLDSPDVREDATDATEEDGGHHGDFFYGRRPVVLQGTIIASSATQRNERVDKLKRATNALRGDAILKWAPLGGPSNGVELKLRRQQPLRVTKGYTKEFQAPMVSADAYIRSATPETAKLAITGGTLTPKWVKGGSEGTDVDGTAEFLYFLVGYNTIKRCKLDGSELTTIASITKGATSLVVGTEKIYWVNRETGFIGRCNLNGTTIENSWVSVSAGCDFICSDGTFLYWTNFLTNKIGKVNKSGAGKNESLVTGCNECTGIDTNGGNLYWVNKSSKTIGFSTTAGGSVNQSLYSGFASLHGGLHVNATKNMIYVSNLEGNVIYKVGLFTGQIETMIAAVSANGTGPAGVHSNSEFLYWMSAASGEYIGRASLAAKMSGKIKSGGAAGSYFTIKAPGPISSMVIKNATTGKKIELLGAFQTSQARTLNIDMKQHIIADDLNNNYYYAYTFPSDWLELQTGENTIETQTLSELELVSTDAWL